MSTQPNHAAAWESALSQWAQPPGKTEQQRCDNAVSAIRNAIAASNQLQRRSTHVFAQGSYRNRVNVRKDSDVDVGVLCTDTQFIAFPPRYTREHFGLVPATYLYPQFKNEVGQALVDYFGQGVVTRGNKAFEVRANTYHVQVDVAPFFEHRRYNANGTYISGVELTPDRGGRIINWPEQHYQNAVAKNTRTGRRFKALVRILKTLRNQMEEAGVAAAGPIPSFLIECLVYNVPDSFFGQPTYTADVRYILSHLYSYTRSDDQCAHWTEVSELKYLFGQHQPWTRSQVNAFVAAAWAYLGF